ncbi:MAG TPA: hypothetical protein DCZ92_10590 [Elusimicrobia bacterium]|nr:MAG: hypothetical protein A2016_11145 [Elusimicrobia bacterium GWF2_62_30]HBA61242.1 hypothetical protein [Elusimicrobiota bacterium]
MAETLGSLADKISIIQLKIFHMREQLARPDADEAHKAACAAKLEVMAEQCSDLETEAGTLLAAYAAGTARPKIYRQFKMYNDPKYRAQPAKQAGK